MNGKENDDIAGAFSRYYKTLYNSDDFNHDDMRLLYNDVSNSRCNHGRPQEFFQGGGQTFGGGGPKKIVKGGPHIFFRQALKYAFRGGGCSFDARRVFF